MNKTTLPLTFLVLSALVIMPVVLLLVVAGILLHSQFRQTSPFALMAAAETMRGRPHGRR